MPNFRIKCVVLECPRAPASEGETVWLDRNGCAYRDPVSTGRMHSEYVMNFEGLGVGSVLNSARGTRLEVLELSSLGVGGKSTADVLSDSKADTGKPRFDLLDYGCAQALLDVVKVLTWAVEVKRYEPHSWKSVPDARRRYEAALSRHRNALARGETHDEESGFPHQAHIATNALFLAQLEYESNAS